MRPKRTVRATFVAPFESLGTLLSSHRAITRVSLAAISFTLIIAFSQQAPALQAGPETAPVIPESLLPQNVGVGLPTDSAVTISFDTVMNPASVEDALQVLPSQPVELAWSDTLDAVTVTPERRWRTGDTYLVVIGASAERTDGQSLSAPRRYSFTTQVPTTVADFQVRLADANLAAPSPDADAREMAENVLDADALVPNTADAHAPSTTALDVSASSKITVSFSQPMNQPDVEERFAITPDVPGDLSWEGNDLVYAPTQRLEPGTRYTVSLVGSHDDAGNVIGGKGNF